MEWHQFLNLLGKNDVLDAREHHFGTWSKQGGEKERKNMINN